MYYRFAEMIESSLNIIFLCEMVGCTIIICFLEFGVVKVSPKEMSRKSCHQREHAHASIHLFQEWEDGKILSMGTYFVLMTSIFVNVYIISAIGDRLKEEVIFSEQYQTIHKVTEHALIAIDGLID